METHASNGVIDASASARRASSADAALAAARTGVSRLRLVAGHPAIDFVNSQSGPAGGEPDDDAVGSYPELLAWTEYTGILRTPDVERLSALGAEQQAGAREVLERAIELRAALHALFEAIAHGGTPPGAELELLAATERDAIAGAVLVPRGSIVEWSWPDSDDLARPIWIIAHTAVDLLRTGPLDRLKQCRSCRFLFVDESKNRSRRWCAMSDCGTASKTRLYVRRRAERRAEQRAERRAEQRAAPAERKRPG